MQRERCHLQQAPEEGGGWSIVIREEGWHWKRDGTSQAAPQVSGRGSGTQGWLWQGWQCSKSRCWLSSLGDQAVPPSAFNPCSASQPPPDPCPAPFLTIPSKDQPSSFHTLPPHLALAILYLLFPGSQALALGTIWHGVTITPCIRMGSGRPQFCSREGPHSPNPFSLTRGAHEASSPQCQAGIQLTISLPVSRLKRTRQRVPAHILQHKEKGFSQDIPTYHPREHLPWKQAAREKLTVSSCPFCRPPREREMKVPAPSIGSLSVGDQHLPPLLLLLLKPRRQQRGAGVVLVPFYDVQIKTQIARVDVQVSNNFRFGRENTPYLWHDCVWRGLKQAVTTCSGLF